MLNGVLSAASIVGWQEPVNVVMSQLRYRWQRRPEFPGVKRLSGCRNRP